MKRPITVMLLSLIMLGIVFNTACSGNRSSNGMSFVRLGSFADEMHISYADTLSYEERNGYCCVVGPDVSSNLVIPDEYKGKPVYMVTSEIDNNAAIRFQSIDFGSNTKYIYRFLYTDKCCEELSELVIPEGVVNIYSSLKNCNSLTKLVFPSSANRIDSSFEGCRVNNEIEIPSGIGMVVYSFEGTEDLTFNVEGDTRFDDCFRGSKNIDVIISNEEKMDIVGKYFWADFNEKEDFTIRLGTKEFLDYSDMADEADVMERAKSHFCETLDPDKEIDPADAVSFAQFLDGPVVSVKDCPDVFESDYLVQDPKVFLNSVEPVYISIGCMASYNAWSYYHPDTTKAPSVYFIAEKMVGDSEIYTDGAVSKTFYHMKYRMSVRDMQSDELICWFVVSEGDAPRQSPSHVTEGEREFLRNGNSNPIPQYVVRKYFTVS